MVNKVDSVKISVIVPIYNSDKYLEQCIDSLVNQTYRDLEIILVDDGSIDGSSMICERYAEYDKRIKVIHKINGGAEAARADGIAVAEGTYITFADSDDYIDLDAFERIIEKVDRRHFPDIIAYGLLEEEGKYQVRKSNQFAEGVYCRSDMESIIFPQMLSCGSFFTFGILPNLCCKLFKRTYMQKLSIHVDEGIAFGEDADRVYQMMLYSDSIQIIDDAPYHYCQHHGSMVWKPMDFAEIKKLENDLKVAFERVDFKEILLTQLKDYIKFVSLLKAPRMALPQTLDLESKKVAVYGAGGFGQAIYSEYSDNVVVWVDQAYEKYQKQNLAVSSVECLLNKMECYDVVFIAILSTKICLQVKKELLVLGINKPVLYVE